MITLTFNVPNVNAVMGAGFTHLRTLKSSNQTPTGTYSQLPNDIPLVLNTTSYTYVDPVGLTGDWYETVFINLPGGNPAPSSPSAPQPGYLSDMCNTIRDLLGVTTANVTDAQIQGFGLLPSAFARVRKRLPTFDTLVGAGGDAGALALSALAHLVAGLLAPRMTAAVFDLERFKDYQYQRNRQLDWSATGQALLDEYEVLISLAAGETAFDGTVDTPMLLAGPTTGGFDVSGGLVPFYPTGGNRTGSQYDPNTGD